MREKARDGEAAAGAHLGKAGAVRQKARGELVRVARVVGRRLGVEVVPTGAVHVKAPLRAGDVDDRSV